MIRTRLATILPALALGAGLVACAPAYDPYYAGAPATVVAPGYAPSGYAAAPYATPAPGYAGQPAYVGQGEYDRGYRRDGRVGPGYAVAPVPADPYCREAYAAAAGAQQQAAISGSYADAARADRSASFLRRDC
jgi:hypothetical protein